MFQPTELAAEKFKNLAISLYKVVNCLEVEGMDLGTFSKYGHFIHYQLQLKLFI